MTNMAVPKISIVTASFNQARYIDEAITSVAKQGYPEYEHIVFDNCSDDGTRAMLAKYRDLKWVSESDGGQSEALNKGFRKASGDLVGWLNADDRYLPGCFHAVAEIFNKTPDAGVIFGDYRWVDQGGRLIKIRRESNFDIFTYKYLHVPCFGSTAVFFNRKIFDAGFFLDPTFHYAMDYELLLRLAVRGYKFVYAGAILADFRWHAECKSTLNRKKQIAEKERALMMHDDLIRGIRMPVRPLVRLLLMGMARAKRIYYKSCNASRKMAL